MRCEKVRLKIDAYVSCELSAQVRSAVEEHLKACDGCRQAAATARQLIVLGQTLPTPPVPDGFAQQVQAMARQRVARPVPTVASWDLAAWWRMVSMPMRAAAAAVLVIGLLAGLAMGWATVQAPAAKPSAQAAPQGDPLAGYNLDYLGDAPSGSLADGYMALLSGLNGEGN